jgi:type VI secretion system secreted protein VgrG
MTGPTIDIKLSCNIEQPFTIVRCTLKEGISQLSHCEVEIASRDDIPFENVLRDDAVIELIMSGVPGRKWTFKVGSAAFTDVKQGSLRYRLDLYDHLWLLRHTRDTRKFRELSAQQIITQVLDQDGVRHRWETQRQTPTRKYCAQYHESNLDFVTRLLEYEGIYFTHDEDGVLVFQDRSTASPSIDGDHHFDLTEHAGSLEGAELGIFSFSKGARVASGTATVNDHNWKNPKVDLLRSEQADRDAELEVYDFPTGYRRPDQAEYFAKIRLEALRVEASYVDGSSNVGSFEPARSFDFGSRAGAMFEDEYCLLEVTHEVTDPAFLDEQAEGGAKTYSNQFRAIPKDVPFRPALTTPRPTIQGVHTARVRGPAGEEIHTDQYGRFRAQFHWDREAKETDEDSRWLRALQETTTGQVLSRIGWEASVAYIDGDPDRPLGIARNINGVMAPTYAQPTSKNIMAIQTPSSPAGPSLTSPAGGGYNELKLDDTMGAMLFAIRAERDLQTEVKRNKTETIGNNETHYVGRGFNETVENDQTIAISGNSDTTVSKNHNSTINQDRSLSISGNETIENEAGMFEATAGNQTDEVGGDRQTTSGKLRGSIAQTSQKNFHRIVGGAYVSVAKENIFVSAKRHLTEIVGGDKTTTATEGNIQQTISGPMDVTITGNVLRTSTDNMSVGTKLNKVDVVGGATFGSDTLVELRGDHISLEAKSKLSFQSSALEITLEPSKTTVKGHLRLEAGNRVDVAGSDDNLT